MHVLDARGDEDFMRPKIPGTPEAQALPEKELWLAGDWRRLEASFARRCDFAPRDGGWTWTVTASP